MKKEKEKEKKLIQTEQVEQVPNFKVTELKATYTSKSGKEIQITYRAGEESARTFIKEELKALEDKFLSDF